MSSKVLVADDSLTIQKVVSITLSGDEFTLIECLNENDLVAKVSSQEFDLILIDFNLSESRTGYQLCKEISSISQKTPIMVMLGTFDSIQDDELQQSGAQDKIVKPFESEKFIRKCRELIAGVEEAEQEDDFEDDIEAQEDLSSEEDTSFDGSSDESDDQWVVDTPGVEFEVQEEIEEETNKADETEPQRPLPSSHALESELENWGVSVPGVIGQNVNESGVELPPVIESAQRDQVPHEVESEVEAEVEIESEVALEPLQKDLEYPDLDASSKESAPEAEPKSRLVPLDDLEADGPDEELEADDDATDPEIQVGGLDELKKEIEDDLSPDEFWATDSDDDRPADEDRGLRSGAIENPVIEEEVQATQNKEENDESSSGSGSLAAEQVDIDELAEKIKERLTPMLDEWAKKYCEHAIDKVAWEVIPDLAENLIRKEIQEISETVKD